MKKHMFIRSALSAAVALTVSVQSLAKDDIEEVMVMGLKVERSLQDTPVSVALTTAEDIKERALSNVYDVLQQSANVTGELGAGYSIRGINAFGVDTTDYRGGNNNALATLYVDGAPMPYRTVQHGALTAWDVQQVEVLRGPQSTLQGKNTLAGAVVMTTTKPSYEWGADVKVEMGSDGRQGLAFAGGGALIEDQLALRISAEDSEFDGYNEASNLSTNADYSESNNYRAKLLFEPKALQGFSALLTYTKAESDNGVLFVNVPEAGENPFDHRELNINTPTHEFTDVDLYNLRMDYQLNEHWDLTSITAYTDSGYGYEWDSDAGASLSSQQFDDRTDTTLSQELRLVFDYERASGVVGLYYSDLESKDNYYGKRQMTLESLGVADLLPLFGVPESLVPAVMGIYTAAGSDPIDLGLVGDNQQLIETMALFGDLEYQLTDQWDLLLGARLERETQSRTSADDYTINNDLPSTDPAAYGGSALTAGIISVVNAQILALASSASVSTPNSSETFNEFLPKAGLTYHWNEDLSYSFIYQEGYRSGGISYNLARGTTKAYDAEYTKNYELSMRSVWLDGALTLNANAFYVDWSGQQLTVKLGSGQYDKETANVGKSEVMGFEVDASYLLNDSVTVYGGLGLSSSEFKDYVSNDKVYDGRPFAGSPEWTGNLGMTYTSPEGIFVNANVNYTDDSIAELTENGGTAIESMNDSRTVIDLRVGYEWQQEMQWGAYLTVKNLLDEEYVVAAEAVSDGTQTHTLGAPRQVSMELRASF